LPGFEATVWSGLMVPAGTPQPIVDLLYRGVVKVMAMPDTRERLASMGFDPVASTPEEFWQWMKSGLARWTKVIRDAKIAQQ
jgi:tripartite-type tricarboxylate transporter receptor subunit TctC